MSERNQRAGEQTMLFIGGSSTSYHCKVKLPVTAPRCGRCARPMCLRLDDWRIIWFCWSCNKPEDQPNDR